jgi:hypothetical protein
VLLAWACLRGPAAGQPCGAACASLHVCLCAGWAACMPGCLSHACLRGSGMPEAKVTTTNAIARACAPQLILPKFKCYCIQVGLGPLAAFGVPHAGLHSTAPHRTARHGSARLNTARRCRARRRWCKMLLTRRRPLTPRSRLPPAQLRQQNWFENPVSAHVSFANKARPRTSRSKASSSPKHPIGAVLTYSPSARLSAAVPAPGRAPHALPAQLSRRRARVSSRLHL